MQVLKLSLVELDALLEWVEGLPLPSKHYNEVMLAMTKLGVARIAARIAAKEKRCSSNDP